MNCQIDHYLDSETNKNNIYDASRTLIEFRHMARLLMGFSVEERGPTLREVMDFISLLERNIESEYPRKQELMLRFVTALEKGLDPADLREILFCNMSEFRAVILNALHARGESLMPNISEPRNSVFGETEKIKTLISVRGS